MIVRNEEKALGRCLSSVKDVVDEMIVVDTGSLDGTKQIAESFGAKVFDFRWTNDFSAARNFALSKCTMDYILYLDADEELPELSRSAILKILSEIEKPLALKCKIKNIDDFSGRIHYGTYCRFFPNLKGVQFEGKVHEQVENSLSKLGIEIDFSDVEILHHGYNISLKEKRLKAKRNLPLLLEEYSANPASYYAYQLGLTYSILNDSAQAEKYFLLALKDEHLPADYRVYSYEFLINRRLKEKKYLEAKQILDEIFKENLTHPSIFLLASKVYSALRQFEQSLTFAISSYELNQTPFADKKMNLVFERLNDEEIVFHGLTVALFAKSEEGFFSFLNRLKIDLKKPDFATALKLIFEDKEVTAAQKETLKANLNEFSANFLLELIREYSFKHDLRDLIVSVYEKFPNNPQARIVFAEFLLKNGDYDVAVELLEDYIERFTDNPFVAFYLISVYLERNQIGKILKPVEYLGKHFPNDPDVLKGLQKISNELFQLT